MFSKLKALSLSHQLAPIEIREKIALSEHDCRSLLLKIKEVTGASEALLLSTCNRTEIYYVHDEEIKDNLLGLLAIEKGMPRQELEPYFTYKQSEGEAVRHLFRVAMGLESQVVGDLQISNQVKKAYQLTADADMAGPFLHRLLHTIFFTNKRVVQETSFRDGAASVSYAATEMVHEFAQGIHRPRVLVVGLGEIGTDVVKNLEGSKLPEITICNRTYSKAVELADEHGFKTLPFEQLWEGVQYADIVISSVAAAKPLFSHENLKQLDILSFKYFLDLSVPRSVEGNAEELSGILVYDVDKINNRTQEAISKRVAAIPQVEQIIEETVAELEHWSKEMLFSPTIQKLKGALEDIRREELARYLKKMDEAQLEIVEKITKGMMNKILKMPVMQLKAACKRGEAETLVDVLNDLFNLEKKAEEQKH